MHESHVRDDGDVVVVVVVVVAAAVDGDDEKNLPSIHPSCFHVPNEVFVVVAVVAAVVIAAVLSNGFSVDVESSCSPKHLRRLSSCWHCPKMRMPLRSSMIQEDEQEEGNDGEWMPS